MKMKKSVALLLFLYFASSAWAVENPWDQKLPFKSAMVEFKISGTMAGDKTIYIKDYGRTRAEYNETTMKMFGMTQQQKEIIITTPDWEYTIDLVEMTGVKQANLNKYMTEEFDKLSTSDQKKVVENAEKMGIATVDGMEGSVEKKASKILGYTCDRVTMGGVVSYTITGTDLPLKISGDMMGVKISQVATNIKQGAVHASKFKLPANIDFQHDVQTDQMMQEQAKTVIQTLLTGETVSYTNSPPPEVPEQQSQTEQVLEKDAKDVGYAAKQEAKDVTTEEVREGVRSLFKSIFD
jgi:hypothetical protein